MKKVHCWLHHEKLDGLCTQECYTHEPLPFQWPSRMSVQQVLTLECTYRSRSRWWHGTASRSFTPLQTPSSLGIPWQSACCRDPGRLLTLRGLAWNLLSKHLWNAKMKLIVRSFSWMHPIPGLLSWGHPQCLQECLSGCRLHHWWHVDLSVISGPPERNWMIAISVMVEGIDLILGMYWGVLRQHPLVMAYRGRTSRNWIIEVTMCCPERTG